MASSDASADTTTVTAAPVPATVTAELPLGDDPVLGKEVGGYRLVRRLGEGAMARVYLGEHPRKGLAALKVPHTFARPLYEEASAAMAVHHPHVVETWGLCSAPWGCACLTMEYVDGRPLKALMHGSLPRLVAVSLIRQLCGAVGAAHRCGVVHCDLKPTNVLLMQQGGDRYYVKLLDFGIAQGPGIPPRAPGMVVGTPRYMSPEQGRGDPVDARTDVFAIGVMAYELLTGRHPFPDRPEELPRPPIDVVPTMSPQLSAAIMRALAPNPKDRFADAAEFELALSHPGIAHH